MQLSQKKKVVALQKKVKMQGFSNKLVVTFFGGVLLINTAYNLSKKYVVCSSFNNFRY